MVLYPRYGPVWAHWQHLTVFISGDTSYDLTGNLLDQGPSNDPYDIRGQEAGRSTGGTRERRR
jgi:hypothetical protein